MSSHTTVASPPRLDAISLEIMWHRLINIADEMYTTVLRTAVSNAIGASQDFGCELLTPEGSSIAHAPRSMPVFNLIMPEVVRSVLRKYPLETMQPGDIYTTNDPWICAGHLDDIAIVTPIFRDDRIVAFANTVAHASSIGGALDGISVKDLHEEGLFFPILKLYDRGQPNETLFEIIRTNVRQPEMVLTDIEAQVAANTVAARRLLAFMDEYQLDSLAELTDALQHRAEAAMRRAIDEIPDGVYEAEEPIEGVDEPLKLQVRIEIRGSDIAVDYAGTSPQTLGGGVNCTFTYTRAHTVYPLKSLLTPDVPNNEGCFKPIKITAPERSVLHALPPASVNSRTKTGWHLHAVIFRALANALPSRVQAGNGLMYTVRIHAYDRDGTQRIAKITCGGGRGAGYGYDGLTRNCYPSSASNVPIEIVESRAPVLVEEKALVPDSGGQGKWRGAPGQRLTIRKLPDFDGTIAFYIHPDRLRFPPPGVFGGEDGHRNVILKNGQDQATGGHLKSGEILLEAADATFTTIIAGGGGYGDPADRSRAAAERDLAYGYTTQLDD